MALDDVSVTTSQIEIYLFARPVVKDEDCGIGAHSRYPFDGQGHGAECA
ncbi:Uncharacterised protein [Achromobacter aegrifaciens]|uniref:Uncharacterized protein n=1 Tax=Achromobacter aegrifaciens TaxID=1287736 RepID=A0AAD2J2C3_ACHAE|nr:Uncharacterised protein [Achromobacter aegrifaciens]